jgi:hypothetical protein
VTIASRANRASRSGVGRRTSFSATTRPVRGSRARKTRPSPPRASSPSTSNRVRATSSKRSIEAPRSSSPTVRVIAPLSAVEPACAIRLTSPSTTGARRAARVPSAPALGAAATVASVPGSLVDADGAPTVASSPASAATVGSVPASRGVAGDAVAVSAGSSDTPRCYRVAGVTSTATPLKAALADTPSTNPGSLT